MSRIALITGGTSGIGKATAILLKSKGYKVAVTYGGNDERANEFKEETSIPVYKWDVADFDQCVEGVKKVREEIGDPEILINNAGITSDSMMHKMDLKTWSRVMHVNLDSVFNMSRQVIGSMRDKKFGRIVNISSINAQKGQFGQTNYCASKAGIIGFTKALALESARANITVNAIAPGYVDTAMTESVPDKILDSIVAQIPIGRLGKPDEIARLAAFLVDDTSEFITGATFSANGGQYIS